MWETIQATLQERYKPFSGHVKDVVDGSEYRKLCESSGILPGSNCLSTLNTDGIPIFNSSSVSVWPVFLAINEIPPWERYVFMYISL